MNTVIQNDAVTVNVVQSFRAPSAGWHAVAVELLDGNSHGSDAEVCVGSFDARPEVLSDFSRQRTTRGPATNSVRSVSVRPGQGGAATPASLRVYVFLAEPALFIGIAVQAVVGQSLRVTSFLEPV
jgi:hypothetical protein